jgi:hypothetical protein
MLILSHEAYSRECNIHKANNWRIKRMIHQNMTNSNVLSEIKPFYKGNTHEQFV